MARRKVRGLGMFDAESLLDDVEIEEESQPSPQARALGSFGPVAFEIGPDRIATPENGGQAEASGRWATHETIEGKPIDQFIGPGLRNKTEKIKLLRELGVDVDAEIETLKRISEQGEIHYLNLGGRVLGQYSLRRVGDVTARSDHQGTREAVVTLEFTEHNDGS